MGKMQKYAKNSKHVNMQKMNKMKKRGGNAKIMRKEN